MALFKAYAARDVARRRRAIRGALELAGVARPLLNGAGTGSLVRAAREPWLSELTAGSGFLQPHLFDYYAEHRGEPAIFFALRVTRLPAPGFVTCQGGGFLASGAPGADRAPRLHLPEGLEATSAEGFGEVQTPLRLPPGLRLRIGDPVLCRPAKAGEIAERFDEYLLVRGGRLVGRAKTYRGLGLVAH